MLLSRGRADAGVLYRTANVTAGATIAFDAPHVVADVRVNGFDGIQPILVSTVNADPTAAELHLSALVGRAQRPGWAARAKVHLDRSGPAKLGLASLGIGVVLEGLADGPAPEVELQRLDGPALSRFILTGCASGRRVELRPADMASPFGAQILTGLGSDIVRHADALTATTHAAGQPETVPPGCRVRSPQTTPREESKPLTGIRNSR